MAEIRTPALAVLAALGLMTVGSASDAAEVQRSAEGAWEVVHFVEGASKITATIELVTADADAVVEVFSSGRWEVLSVGADASGTGVRVAEGTAQIAWGIDAGDEIIWVGND